MLIPVVLFGWIPFVVLLFALLPTRKAAILGFLLAWMFLPVAGYNLPGIPPYTKSTAATLGVFLGTLLFDSRKLFSVRFSWFDVPMIVWCLTPFASSVANGLGPYDGASAILENVITWGLPYYLGRAHIRDVAGMRELAVWLFIGGLIYVPLCWIEIRLSPQLSNWVYGLSGAGVAYFSELGKWGSRPMVFMSNGLALGMFMTACSLAGFWLWKEGELKQLGKYRVGYLVAILIFTSVMCKNMGALVLLCLGIGCLLGTRYLNRTVLIYGLVAVAPCYMLFRGTGKFGGDGLVAAVRVVHETRAKSLQTRLDNEDILVAKAMMKPVFGWGRWGDARVYEETVTGDLRDVSITDGFWVIALGNTGLVGLLSITCAFLGPAVAYWRRFPAHMRPRAPVAAGAALAVVAALYMIDCLFNAMVNPVFMLGMGALVSLAQTPRRLRSAVASSKRVSPSVPGTPLVTG